MSFGFSIGDLAALVSLAKKTYDGWRQAPKEYADVVQTLSESNTLLCHVERRFDTLTGTENDAGKQKEIGDLLRGCQGTISELRSVIKRRRRLGHWDRIRLGSGASHVNDCRNRLARHINILTPFLFSLELESIGKDNGSIAATLDRLPQVLLNALPAALGKMIDHRIEDSRTARGSIMTTYGDDDDKQAYKELRRNLRFFGIKDSVVRQQRTKLVEFIRTLTHDEHDITVDDCDDDDQTSEEQTVPGSAPPQVSQVLHTAEDVDNGCAGNASRTSYRRYQAYVETEDEDGYMESVVAVPSKNSTTTKPEKAQRHVEDHAHRTHVGDNIEDGLDEPVATKSADANPRHCESNTGTTGRRKYQAYVESEDEDDVTETLRTTLGEFVVPPIYADAPQQTRMGSGDGFQQRDSSFNNLDRDMPRAKHDVESGYESKAHIPVPPQRFPGAPEQSNGETEPYHASREKDSSIPPPSVRCSDPECQECLGTLFDSDGANSEATHESCDGYCSLCDQQRGSDSDDTWEQLSDDDRQRYNPRYRPRRRDANAKRSQRDGNPDLPWPSSSAVPEAGIPAPGPKSPQRMIEYKPLDAAKEGLLTIQVHMPAGYCIYVEGGRVAQFQDRWAPPKDRQYFPALPPYEDYEEYYANCSPGFPSAPVPSRAISCDCRVFYWTPDMQSWNPKFVDYLRRWVMAEGVRNVKLRYEGVAI